MTTKNPCDSLDILDRLSITVFQPVPGHFNVDFACKEFGKVLIIDDDAKKKMEEKITELCSDKNSNSENIRGYIEEFVGRLLQEYYRVGYALIEDAKDAVEDPYKTFRNTNKLLRN